MGSVFGGGWVITAGLSGAVLPKVAFDRERFEPRIQPAAPAWATRLKLGWRFGVGGDYEPAEETRPWRINTLPMRVYARARLSRLALEAASRPASTSASGYATRTTASRPS